MMTLRRWIIGCEYMAITKELEKYDMTPRILWTEQEKNRVIELLEREAELDIELAKYLIDDGDEVGYRVLQTTREFNANQLWNLKQSIA